MESCQAADETSATDQLNESRREETASLQANLESVLSALSRIKQVEREFLSPYSRMDPATKAELVSTQAKLKAEKLNLESRLKDLGVCIPDRKIGLGQRTKRNVKSKRKQGDGTPSHRSPRDGTQTAPGTVSEESLANLLVRYPTVRAVRGAHYNSVILDVPTASLRKEITVMLKKECGVDIHGPHSHIKIRVNANAIAVKNSNSVGYGNYVLEATHLSPYSGRHQRQWLEYPNSKHPQPLELAQCLNGTDPIGDEHLHGRVSRPPTWLNEGQFPALAGAAKPKTGERERKIKYQAAASNIVRSQRRQDELHQLRRQYAELLFTFTQLESSEGGGEELAAARATIVHQLSELRSKLQCHKEEMLAEKQQQQQQQGVGWDGEGRGESHSSPSPLHQRMKEEWRRERRDRAATSTTRRSEEVNDAIIPVLHHLCRGLDQCLTAGDPEGWRGAPPMQPTVSASDFARVGSFAANLPHSISTPAMPKLKPLFAGGRRGKKKKRQHFHDNPRQMLPSPGLR